MTPPSLSKDAAVEKHAFYEGLQVGTALKRHVIETAHFAQTRNI